MEDMQLIRHSMAHILAMAVKHLYPDVKLGIGPAIDDGFYYDFDNLKISENDFPKIEEEMKKIIFARVKFEKKVVDYKKAKELMKDEPYKLDLIEDLHKDKEDISFYYSGSFYDLCAGPHVHCSCELKDAAFKIDRIAGAYWKGDEKNKMLNRIYVLCFATQEELDTYIARREEAKMRDHRKLGKELDLFHIDDKVGLGLPLWHPRGAIIWRKIEDFWYDAHLKNGYQLVRSPHIGNRVLWETSGHWGFYNSSMYPPLEAGQTLEDQQKHKKVEVSEQYLLKPMNCPFHVQIYKSNPRSYKDLPFRWAECGTVYRFEKKGELSGLTRVRGFTQDDAHIMCRKDQVEDELKRVVDFITFIYNSFGFDMKDVQVFLSLRDPNNKEKYIGNDEGWEFTESVLRKIAKEKNLNFTEEIGEAAFYGPKLDFKIQDCLGRLWQCSTLQFDFNLPERFDMTFTNSEGKEERPYMLHRALLGSFERFIGLLIENYGGAFPVWLAPEQVKILAISDRHADYVNSLRDKMAAAGLRVEVDLDNETLGNKIRKATAYKIPYIAIVGDKEMENNKINVRIRGQKEPQDFDIDEFINRVVDEDKRKVIN
ncbi:MAG TPA: threonine--tRNA ligase [bacterium]|nr:threonine--tRNA ligase [bacterium]HQL11474.1 threonine--tRNA ligase [bacterium]